MHLVDMLIRPSTINNGIVQFALGTISTYLIYFCIAI